jgi:hypothetical protein
VYLTQENPVFEKEIIEAGSKASILRATELQVSIMKGITELKNEGWISDSEAQFLNQTIQGSSE